MCYLCLQDFNFELPNNYEKKKKRLLKVKSLLKLASDMKMVEDLMELSERTLCEDKVSSLQEEQYKLSREF